MDDINLLDETANAISTVVATRKGFPNPAAKRGRTPLNLDRLLIKRPNSTYFFRIPGHSWHRCGIFDGDIAIVDRSLTPIPDKIVIVITDMGKSKQTSAGKAYRYKTQATYACFGR